MRNINVLPVYPQFPSSTFWGFTNSIRLTGRKAMMPPTGLATVLSMLPDNFRAQRIIDLNVEPLTDEDIKGADLVFTSSMIVQGDSHDDVVDRAHYFGKKVVVGGPFPTSYPERTNADYIVSGEAEVTLRPFLEELVKGPTKRIWLEKDTKNGSVELTRGGKVKLTNTPLPRWDLMDLGKYFSAAIQFSRGCPFDCDFCDITALFGREPRTKSPEQMIREFNALYEAGHKGPVFVVDDNFIGNREQVRQLLPYVERWQTERNYPFSLFTEASMNLAWEENESILAGMRRAGFNFVFVGIESIDNDVLKKMHKKQNTDDKMSQIEAVRRIQNAGLEVSGGFIIGSDGEKTNVFENLFEFIQDAGIPAAMPGLLTALRNTKLHKRLEREGRLREESTGNNTHQLRFNIVTQLPEDYLIEGYTQLIDRLFSPKNYYNRCRTLMRNLGPNHSQSRVNLEGIATLARSVGHQLFSEGGLEYFKYLAGTLINNPKYFSEAVSHAVKFAHFKKITDETLRADNSDKRYEQHVETLYERFAHEAVRVYTEHKDDIDEAGKKVSKLAKRILHSAEQRFAKLSEDFREGSKDALFNLRNRVDRDLENYVRGYCLNPVAS